MNALARELGARFGPRLGRDAPLAPLTTLRVGGPADLLLEAHSAAEVLEALRLCGEHGVPVTLLGGGSNALVADAGIRGLVLRWRRGAVQAEGPGGLRAEAAVTVNGLVRHGIAHALAGLEAWAGTPGQVGGAVCGNAHFQGRLLSEHVVSVRLASREGIRVEEVSAAAMEFGYDRSRVQRTGEVVLSALFRVRPGEPDALRATARASLAFRKRTQPLHLPSAGCFFQNPDPARDRLPDGGLGAEERRWRRSAHGTGDGFTPPPEPDDLPCSAGALIDRAGLKGAGVGGARVAEVHANFLVNAGGATAADFDALARLCQRRVHERFGIHLREEVARLGDWATAALPRGSAEA